MVEYGYYIMSPQLLIHKALMYDRLLNIHTYRQGWARDVKARDRDETEALTSRDRDGFTS